MTHRPGVSKTLGLLAVATLIAIAVLVAVSQTGIRRADEARRVRHSGGFSIIAPEDWELQSLYPTNGTGAWTLWMLPSKPEGRVGGLWAFRHVDKPKIPTSGKGAMHEGQFQGQPAWVHEDTQHPKLWTRSYLFEREGNWYQVTLSRPAPEDIMGPAWTGYVESFRLEKPLGGTAATFPSATLPAFPTTLPTSPQPEPATNGLP